MTKFNVGRIGAVALVGCAAALSVHAQVTAANSAADATALGELPAHRAAYWNAKAQCWADLSKAEASQGDTRGTARIAAGNAGRIRSALSQAQEPTAGLERPIFGQEILPASNGRYGRPQWRADLVTIDLVMARYSARKCRTPKLGCLEVARQSVYENLEETKGARWNHGRPELDKALALAMQAGSEFEAACDAQEALEAIHVPQTPGLDGIHVPQGPALDVVEVSADLLFKFDQGSASGMLPAARAAIAEVARKIQSHGSAAGSIAVIGHTDRLGLPERNQALSQDRAATVAKLLEDAGVILPIAATGADSSAPVTGEHCKAVHNHHALIDCLQPDRRVLVQILPSQAATAIR